MLEPQQNTHICACRSLLSPCDALLGQERLWPRSDAVWQCRAAAQCALCNELLNKSLSLDRVCHQTKHPESISVTFQRQGAARASAKGCAFSRWQIEWEKKDVWVEARGGKRGSRGTREARKSRAGQKVMDLFSKEITSICTIKNVGAD